MLCALMLFGTVCASAEEKICGICMMKLSILNNPLGKPIEIERKNKDDGCRFDELTDAYEKIFHLLYEGDADGAVLWYLAFSDMAGANAFEEVLFQRGLHSGNLLHVYLLGRQYEVNGDEESAQINYRISGILDSEKRISDLVLDEIYLEKYNQAVALMENEKYEEARSIFEELGTYRESERYAQEAKKKENGFFRGLMGK